MPPITRASSPTANAACSFPPATPTALADALVRMEALGPAGRAEMGARARRFAAEALSLEASVAAWEPLLGRIVQSRR